MLSKYSLSRVGVAGAALLCALATAEPVGAQSNDREAIVRVVQGVPVVPIIQAFQGIAVDSIISQNAFLVEFPDSIPLDSILEILAARPGVLDALRNNQARIGEPYQISQSFPDQYHQPFLSGQSPAAYYEQATTFNIGLDGAHQLSAGAGVTVAVIDNGIDMTHSLFADRLATDLDDLIDGDGYPEEAMGEAYGHGTFVSGLVFLAAPECTLIPVRAFDGDGYGTSFYIAQAIWIAVERGADIINMSFGMTVADKFVAAAITDAWSAGIVLVAAVGNDADSVPTYPAAFPEVIGVSAYDAKELAASWTNFGAHVDLCAPGESVYSTLPGDYKWGTWSGTSFSAPLVSGVIALVKSRAPQATTTTLCPGILETARDSLLWGWVDVPSTHYGYGAADALNAVLAWSRGDCDLSGEVNVSDLTGLVGYLFQGEAAFEPDLRIGDVGCDNAVNVADVTQLVAYLFRAGRVVVPCSY